MNTTTKRMLLATDSAKDAEFGSTDLHNSIEAAYDAAKPENTAPLKLLAAENRVSGEGDTFRDFYCEGLQTMWKIERNWLDMAVQWNLALAESCTNALWFVPGITFWHQFAGQTFAAFTTMHKGVMELAVEQSRVTSRITVSGSGKAKDLNAPFEWLADTFERGMDLLVGTQRELLEIAAASWKAESAQAA